MKGAERLEDEIDGPDFSEPSFNAGDPEQVHLRKRQAGRKKKEQSDFITNVMSDEVGRAWVWSLLSVSHIFSTSVVAGDPYATHVLEGERNIGLRILGDIMAACPQLYVVMTDENSGKGKK